MDYLLKAGEMPAFAGIYEEIDNGEINSCCYINDSNNILPPTKTSDGYWRWTGRRQKDKA